jgi:hypothetical protein
VGKQHTNLVLVNTLHRADLAGEPIWPNVARSLDTLPDAWLPAHFAATLRNRLYVHALHRGWSRSTGESMQSMQRRISPTLNVLPKNGNFLPNPMGVE